MIIDMSGPTPLSAPDSREVLSGALTLETPGALASESQSAPAVAEPPVYGSVDLHTAIADLCRGLSVHITAATFVEPFERLALPLAAGATSLILSDAPQRSAACVELCAQLRERFPTTEIKSLTVKYDDYWQCREAPRADIVIDLGQIIHDVAPDRRIVRLAQMARKLLFVSAMVIPPSRSSMVLDGDILAAGDLTPGEERTRVVDDEFRRRGVILPQLNEQIAFSPSWLWFFTPASLIAFGRAANLRLAECAYVWSQIAVGITFVRDPK